MTARYDYLLGDGVKRSSGGQSRRYNLLAARLIADLVKGLIGPRGLEKMFIDILGETTVTKNGATFLRKIDVEHPAAKLMIEASNAVDNAVGDGTTSVVVLAGSLLEKAEELLDMGIPLMTISDGYNNALHITIENLRAISVDRINSDRKIMEHLANTCLKSKIFSFVTEEKNVASMIVNIIHKLADFSKHYLDLDDIKIEEKIGVISETEVIEGVVIDKTIDNPSMSRFVEDARILLLDTGLDDERTKTDSEIRISSQSVMKQFLDYKTKSMGQKVQHVIDSGANVVFARGGIDPLAQTYLAQRGILSVRRVKENDLLWLEKATGANVTRDLERISNSDLGFASKVYEKFVGDDKMVFVDGCKNPKAVTLLLRASSKVILDELHRAALSCFYVLKDFITVPKIVAGGGSAEATIAHLVRQISYSIEGKEQIVVQKFAEALEEIPLAIAANAGMNRIDTVTQLREKIASQFDLKGERLGNSNKFQNGKSHWYGVNAIERKIDKMMRLHVIEPLLVKEQVFVSAAELVSLLIRVDDVLIAKQVSDTHSHSHTHADGTSHSHKGGNKAHEHFDRLGKVQRPAHHYY